MLNYDPRLCNIKTMSLEDGGTLERLLLGISIKDHFCCVVFLWIGVLPTDPI